MAAVAPAVLDQQAPEGARAGADLEDAERTRARDVGDGTVDVHGPQQAAANGEGAPEGGLGVIAGQGRGIFQPRELRGGEAVLVEAGEIHGEARLVHHIHIAP